MQICLMVRIPFSISHIYEVFTRLVFYVPICYGSPSSGPPSLPPTSFHSRPVLTLSRASSPFPHLSFFSPALLFVPEISAVGCRRPGSHDFVLCPHAWPQGTHICQRPRLCPSCRFSISLQLLSLTFILYLCRSSFSLSLTSSVVMPPPTHP